MSEPTNVERLIMLLRTIASTAGWIVAIAIKIGRGMLPGGESK